MRVLFVIRAVEHYPYFRSIVEALLDRDHDVKILFDRDWSQRGLGLVGIKTKGVHCGWTVPYLVRLRRIIFWIRDLLSYIRYLKVRGQSGFYKDRWRKVLFVPVQWFLKIPFVEFLLKTKVTGRVLAVLETVTGPVSEIVEDIRQFDPAVVVATPANMPHSSADLEYLKAARALSIPTALPVFSWDNLTTKGLIHIKPKVLLAWNEKQVQEAWKHHGIAKRDIRICGAFLFDFWFKNHKPSEGREAFCKKWGIDAKWPILCYLETSDSLTGDERGLVLELSHKLKKSRDSKLKNTQIIVRPHPFKSHFGNFNELDVFVIPKRGTWPKDEDSIQLYFDTLYFSFAVFGINTSGLIDAVCCDKPIVTLNLEQYGKTQSQTEHFKQLIKNDVLEISSREEFSRILAELLRGKDRRRKQRANFIKKFIRPKGLEVASGETAALEIEKLAYQNIQ